LNLFAGIGKKPQIQTLLKELKAEEKTHPVGATRSARWYPGPGKGVTG